MKSAKYFIKAASVCNLFSAFIYAMAHPIIGVLLGIISLLLWIISEEEENEISSYSTFLFLLACILIVGNFLSAILVFVALIILKTSNPQSEINAPPKKIIKKVIIDPEIKKIDTLLKLGVGMVLISGILFATTSWESISIEWKAVGLLLLGCLFLFLSQFTEKRLKLYMTTYMYWLLSMSFFTLTIVGALYFGIFNTELTYLGTKKELAYAITFLTTSGLSFASYLKFSKNYLAYTAYTSILCMMLNFLNAFLTPILSIIIILTILLLCNILNKKNQLLSDVTKMATYCFFILTTSSINNSNSLLVLLACSINIINLYYLTFTDNQNLSILHLILIYVLSAIGIFNLDLSADYNAMIFFIFTTLHTLFIITNLVKQPIEYHQVNYALYSICSLANFVILNANIKEIAFIIPVLYLIINIIHSMDIKKITRVEYAPYLGPISILVLVYSILELALPEDIGMKYIIVTSTILYCLINYFMKKENLKVLYKICIIIGIIATLETNIISKDTIPALLVVLPSCYLFFFTYQDREKEKWPMVVAYLALLCSVYSITTIVNVLQLSIILSSISFIWFLLVIIFLIKDKWIRNISLFAIILPIYDIIKSLTINTEYYSIMISILTLYIGFLIVTIICKEKEFKNLIGTLAVIIAVLEVVTIPTLSVGIYVGIVGIVVILLGYYYSKELPAFFTTGILITIINIIYQLKDLWGLIPFWLYLLLGGLSLLFFVTYRELKNSNKK